MVIQWSVLRSVVAPNFTFLKEVKKLFSSRECESSKTKSVVQEVKPDEQQPSRESMARSREMVPRRHTWSRSDSGQTSRSWYGSDRD